MKRTISLISPRVLLIHRHSIHFSFFFFSLLCLCLICRRNFITNDTDIFIHVYTHWMLVWWAFILLCDIFILCLWKFIRQKECTQSIINILCVDECSAYVQTCCFTLTFQFRQFSKEWKTRINQEKVAPFYFHKINFIFVFGSTGSHRIIQLSIKKKTAVNVQNI